MFFSRHYLGSLTHQHHLAYCKTGSRPESGAWHICIPSSRVGTFIDNDILSIGVALRVVLSVCIPHRCKCGMTVDAFGTHHLSCHFNPGRIYRHSALSDIVRRGLSAAGMPSRWNNSAPLLTWPLSHLGRYVRQHLCIFESNTSHASRWFRRRRRLPQENRHVRYVGPTLHLTAHSGRDVLCHGKIDDPIFQKLGPPIGRAITESTQERFPASESVLGYSQRERVQHFAVIP